MRKLTSTFLPIKIPLINPNEPDVRLVSVYVANDQYIHKNESIASIETTKSTQDILAIEEGYITYLRHKMGDHLKAGEILCYIVDSPGSKLTKEMADEVIADKLHVSPLHLHHHDQEGRRITEPAHKLAVEHQIDLSIFSPGIFITEQVIRKYLDFEKYEKDQLDQKFDPSSIFIYGGGGHAKSLIELIQVQNNFRVIGIIDDRLPIGEKVLGIPVLGGVGALEKYFRHGLRNAVNAVGGIGDIHARINIFETLKTVGFEFPILVHPTSFVEPSAKLSPGVQIMPHAYVGSDAQIGFGTIINTSAVISHDCSVGDYSNISPGALLAGGVLIGSETLIGMGANINIQVKVGRGVRVGNNATVKSDVPDADIVRAGTIWPV
jgi:acetyltransferase EpsM